MMTAVEVDTRTGKTLRAVVVGGGISGLSSAYYLRKFAEENGVDLSLTLLESQKRFGGKVKTDQVTLDNATPFVVEGGPDSFLTQKPWALQLAQELGLEDDLLGTNDHMRNVYVLQKGKPVVLPDGVMMIIPTRFMPFALSPLISPLGKLRMGMDLFIPAKKDDQDETLAGFIRRRLGNEALDKIAEPLMSGIYNAEAERQSIMATFPRFRALEKQHGSLIRGMIASMAQHQSATGNAPTTGKKRSAFMSLRGGTQELIEALTDSLGGYLRENAKVASLIQNADESYTITLEDGEKLTADVVVMTTPSYVSADLVRDIAPESAEQLDGIRYVSTGTISLGFAEEDIKFPLHGFGLVVPQSENRPINAITISSIKFDHRAPEGKVLLRCFFGGSRSPESMDLSDEQLLATVKSELKAILGIEAEPLFHRIYRWFNANPQYDLGHLERVDAIEANLPENLLVTGSAYRGVGMPDCVKQSKETAQKIIEKFTETETV